MTTAIDHHHQSRRAAWCGAWLLLASAVLAECGASVGSTGFDSVLRMHGDPVAWQIVWDIRLPRTLGAWLAGALLGLSGAVAQGLFRNPLADPYLLGSASGAALGGAVAMAMFGVSPVAAQWMARIGITGMAFLGAAGAVVPGARFESWATAPPAKATVRAATAVSDAFLMVIGASPYSAGWVWGP